MGRAADAIKKLEAGYSAPGQWHRKISKAVWRGTAWFNSVHNPRLRQNLLAVSKGKAWADVEPLEWVGDNGNATNALPIEDFCRYKYVLHTEGVAYSGRFQFLQMCASVVLTPPIQWLQHTTHLVRPLFSSSLDLAAVRSKARAKAAGSGSRSGVTFGAADEGRHGWKPSERIRNAWPPCNIRQEKRILCLSPPTGPTWRKRSPGWRITRKLRRGIARRQRTLFADGGYFSPAAEVCYWRALVRGWAKVARTEGEDWNEIEGVPFETFSLTNGD